MAVSPKSVQAQSVGTATCQSLYQGTPNTRTISQADLSVRSGGYSLKFTDSNGSYVFELDDELTVESARTVRSPNGEELGETGRWNLSSYRYDPKPVNIEEDGKFSISMLVSTRAGCDFKGKLDFRGNAKKALFPEVFVEQNLASSQKCNSNNQTYEALIQERGECKKVLIEKLCPDNKTGRFWSEEDITKYGEINAMQCEVITSLSRFNASAVTDGLVGRAVATSVEFQNVREGEYSREYFIKRLNLERFNDLSRGLLLAYSQFPKAASPGFFFIEESILENGKPVSLLFPASFPRKPLDAEPTSAYYRQQESSFRVNGEQATQLYLSLASAACYSFKSETLQLLTKYIEESGFSLSAPLEPFAKVDNAKCSSESSPDVVWAKSEGLDRWWATAADPQSMIVNWTVNVERAGDYELEIHVTGLNSWNLSQGARVTVTPSSAPSNSYSFGRINGYLGTLDLGKLDAGAHTISIDGFSVPNEPVIEEIKLVLDGPTNKEITSLFIADREEVDGLTNVEAVKNRYQAIAQQYAPNLYFDSGEPDRDNSGELTNPRDGKTIGFRPERYPAPVSIQESWKSHQASMREQLIMRGAANSPIDLGKNNLMFPYNCGERNSKIYASISSNRSENEVAINYYFYYPRSNWRDYGGYNNHQGDWEGVVLFFEKDAEGNLTPSRVAFSQHLRTFDGAGSSGVAEVSWEEIQMKNLTHGQDKNSFNVYVGLGGHASFPSPGRTKYFNPGVYSDLVLRNTEFHQGDLCNVLPQVEVLPHLGTITSENYDSYDWLLFPGKWGVKTQGDEGNPPRGPAFLEASLYDREFGDDNELGLRWSDPWRWSDSEIEKTNR